MIWDGHRGVHLAGRCDLYLGILRCPNRLPAPIAFVKVAHIFYKEMGEVWSR